MAATVQGEVRFFGGVSFDVICYPNTLLETNMT